MTVPAIPIAASRSSGDTVATIIEPPEIRKIVMALGLQFTRQDTLDLLAHAEANDEWPAETREYLVRGYRSMLLPEGLADKVPGLLSYEMDGRQHAVYLSVPQNVLYLIECVEDKAAFREALLTDGVVVVYNGHARFGRGPCFGPPGAAPGDNWERGDDPDRCGLFRMSHPFLGIPAHDIVEHGYHTVPLPASEPRPTYAQANPELRPHLGQLRPRCVGEMHGDPAFVARLAELIGVEPDSPQQFWTYRAIEDSRHGVECHLVLYAGWEDTDTAPFDLGATDFRCRMFCHFGCSTFLLNYPVVRGLKGWRRDGDNRLAYWTTTLANGLVGNIWLAHLLTYPEPQAGKSWDPWVRYAVRQTNRDLAAEGERYRLI
jgi:hypothetical protein